MHQTTFKDGIDSPFHELHHPSLNIFKPSERDMSITDFEFIEMSPTGTPTGKDVTAFQIPMYEFNVTDKTAWYDFSQAVIECHFSIVRNDNGANFVDGQLVTFVNNAMNLFKRVSYSQNGISVEETEEPGLIEQIKGLVNYSPDAETHLSNELWSPDRGNGEFTVQSTLPVTFLENFDYNRGLVIRRNKIKSPPVVGTPNTGTYNKRYTVMIPLRKLFPYFDFTRNLMKGVDHKFKLHVNDKNKMIFRTGAGVGVDGKVVYNYLCMWIPKVRPSEKWDKLIRSQMASGMTKSIGWNKWTYYFRDEIIPTAPIGTPGNINWVIPTSEVRPKRLYLILQRSDALSDQTVNSMIFPAERISKLFIRYNGMIIPEYTYDTPTISAAVGASVAQAFPDDRSFMRFYLEFLRAGNKQFSSIPPSISYEEWVKLYAIYCFDLSKIDETKLYNSQTKAHISVDISFNGNLTAASNLHAILESEAMMTLGSNAERLIPQA
jgi:hypothetical protein